ncbi:hypothetical protein PFHG_04012 [Plasmodium falciparum HB3]|uniref:Erythrocyte membrane protein 1 n=1 Tax=Plasmodium falciparum (isolate HB3) TaxID=137071 RepID=A0A0L7KG31_PLAFX|nr:hypothetical protein PFHG_04012 [Plasmodium falciparum HB3]
MAPGSTGTQDDDAKNMFDRIGQQVHEEIVKSEANQYKEALKGNLQKAKGNEELVSTDKPCTLVEEYRSKANGGDASDKRHPCGNGSASDKRFSKERVDEYDEKKIRDTNKSKGGNNEGECAPYRRLSLCNKNFQNINNIDSDKARHNLLAEVCMAAKYEGESIKAHYPKYQTAYGNSPSELCTVLARSFADIGDIIRGKDLYLGYNKKEKAQKEKLEENLQKIFGHIYEELTYGAQNYYKGDREKNYYQLREDWWYANRETVWKAMTCSDELTGASYFHATCIDGNSKSQAKDKCRCQKKDNKPNDQVPTYFDYVPQYLRWFEEWAEEFCRKKKKKLEKLEQQCRGKYQDADRYCSRNGFDCEKTVNARGKVRMGKGCTDCFFACNPYIDWINNQKEQFDKQKNKYKTEISDGGASGGRSGNGRQRRAARNENYKGYEKKFYDKLEKNKYGKVDGFLELLNKEDVCKKNNDIEEGGTIDFNEPNDDKSKEYKGTFYRSEYCQPCPLCGMKWTNDGKGKWEHKKKGKCTSGNLYRPNKNATPTPINFLYSGDRQAEIETKLDAFCNQTSGSSVVGSGDCGGNSDSSLCEPWKCYQFDHLDKVGQDDEDDLQYDKYVQNAGGLCILETTNGLNVKKQKTYNDFFNFWVAHMLKDSIHWKKKLEKCLKNGSKIKCTDRCKTPCDCFEKWVEQKKTEWGQIKVHFYTQEDIVKKGGLLGQFGYDAVLQQVLEKDVLLTSIKEAYGNANEIKHIEELLKETGVVGGENKTTIDKLLQHEEDEAKKCKDCPDPPPAPTGDGPARSLPTPEDSPSRPAQEVGDSEEDEDDDEDDDGKGAEEDEVEEETAKESEPPVKKEEVNVCSIVDGILTGSGKLDDACTQKYAPPQRHWGWKCITPTGSGSTATREGGDRGGQSRAKREAPGVDTTTAGSSGAICIPPRRRKLYVTPLTKLTGDNTVASQAGNTQEDGGKAQTQPQGKGAASTSTTESSQLRDAFIQSAAIETFFLWHKYKMDKEIEKKEKKEIYGDDNLSLRVQDLQAQLNSGTIPEEFKRQMFYTLGDYRDICIGDDTMIKALEASGDTKMKEISSKIEAILKQSGNNQSRGGPPNSVTTPQQTWWKDNAEPIWNGMICALTYKEDTSGEKGTQQITQDEEVKKALLDKEGTSNEPIKYKYNSVKLDEHSGTDGPKSTGGDTPLTQFVLRPPYFRYLEEWGESFCRERKKRLAQIKEDCRGEDASGDPKYCSGDGHVCDKAYLKHHKMFDDFVCRDCYKQCRKYRKWIDIKFEEFHNQKNTYGKEKQKLNGNSNGNNNCCKEIQNLPSAAQFLAALKHCKDDEAGEVKKSNDPNNKIDFNDPKTTFGPLEYCKTCPLNGVNCGSNECKEYKVNGQTWEKLLNGEKQDEETTDINVEMIDRRWPFIKEYLGNSNNSFKISRLFKGLRVQNWKCRFNKDKNMDVCKLDKFDQEVDLNPYITFKVFLEYWLQDFIEGYYILKQKKIIDKCTENGGKTCNVQPKNDCACVKKWVEQKSTQWGKIQEHFNKRKYDPGYDIKYKVKTFLETLIPQMDLVNDKGKISDLNAFLKFYQCKCADNSKSDKEGEKKNIVLCLLEKLGEKAKKCAENHKPSGDTQAACVEKSPNVEDDDEPLEEDEQNTVGKQHPPFCNIEKKAEAEEKGDCDAPEEKTKENDQAGAKELKPPADSTPAPVPVPGPGPPPPPPPPTSVNPNPPPAEQTLLNPLFPTNNPFPFLRGGVGHLETNCLFFFFWRGKKHKKGGGTKGKKKRGENFLKRKC